MLCMLQFRCQLVDRNVKDKRQCGHSHKIQCCHCLREFQQTGNEKRKARLEHGEGDPVKDIRSYKFPEFSIPKGCCKGTKSRILRGNGIYVIFFPDAEYRHKHAYECCRCHGCESDPDCIYSSEGRNQRTPDRRCQIGHSGSCNKGERNDGGYIQAFLLCMAQFRNQGIVRSTVCRDRKVICQNHTKQECRIDPAVFIHR